MYLFDLSPGRRKCESSSAAEPRRCTEDLKSFHPDEVMFGSDVHTRHRPFFFHCSSTSPRSTPVLRTALDPISQTIMLAYFNRRGAQSEGWRRKVGRGGMKNTRSARERDISFLSHHVLLYEIHFLCESSPSLRRFVFLLHHCQCALAEVVQVATSPLDPVSILDPSLPIGFPNCEPCRVQLW